MFYWHQSHDAEPMSHVASYQSAGFVQVDGLLSADEAVEIRDAFMAHVQYDKSLAINDHVPDGDPLARYPRFVQPHRRLDTEVGRIARRWLLEPRILDVVTDLIGPAYAAQSMFYFTPPTARGVAMHQDNFYVQAEPETCVAAWIAVDDCDAENGALSVVPGSHRHDLACPGEADPALSFTRALVAIPDELYAEQTVLRAGDVLFFHGSLLHGSGPNTSTERFRRALILHYVPQDSRVIARFYQPLLTPDGVEVTLDPPAGGGPCGDGWHPNQPR